MAMNDQNTDASGCESLPPASGPGGVGETAARSSLSGESILPSVPAGTAASVVGEGLLDDGRAPELPRSDADDERIALHESSHALAGRLLGQPIGGMTVVASDGFSGRCWGPEFESRFAGGPAVPSLCAQIGPLMPGPGESRADAADIFLHCHVRIVELCAGSVGESLFLPGEAWDAVDDRAQERALASLISNSPESIEAFVGFCAVEAAALLRPREHIVRALAAELRVKRTMDGQAIDRCIEQAVAIRAAENEKRRRLEWREREASAARLVTVKP
jgi:hypothetical protein